jgi:hypothetical protein
MRCENGYTQFLRVRQAISSPRGDAVDAGDPISPQAH